MKTKKINKKLLLIILDGFGINKRYKGNAITKAKIPFYRSLLKKYPSTKLGASEHYVGLPDKQLGSSEVGHSTIGAGRILTSDILRLNKAIKDKSFYNHKILNKSLSKIKKNNALHLVGLVSDGGVHSHIDHLFALLDVVKKHNIKNTYIHVITDGRDVDPKSANKYILQLQKKLNEIGVGEIATISGRYFAMDRDNHWGRQRKVYDLLVNNKGNYSTSISKFIKDSYKKGIYDEFLEPTKFIKDLNIKNKDTIIFFNFRSDRAREFTRMFCDSKFDKFPTNNLKVNFITFCEYDSKIRKVQVLYPPLKQKPGLGQIISAYKLKQLRVAETEKFAHVTYFFNLGQEKPNKKEDRILLHSPSVATYDQKPEMSAKAITKGLLETLDKDYAFTLLNFANPDMVGHSGNIKATIKALEYLDKCLNIILKKVDLNKTNIIITSDHGNCDEMIDKRGNISTSHSLNKVPFILVSKKKYKLSKDKENSLANIAPTILDLLDLDTPEYMLDSLILKK
jgi:2,3-bisphosphoglycerate-independent phosphoglycerate mutase